MCTMDHMKKTVEIGSGPSKRALDMGRTSARCSSRIGCGAKPSFMAETGNKTKTPLNEKGNKKKKLLNEKGNNNKTLISEKGKKKNTSLRSSEKEKPKNLEVASSSIPTKPRVVASGDPIAAPNTGKSSLPHRYGLRRLSCTSSSSISDVVQSDTSNVVDHTSSSSSLRGKGASRAFDSLERQSVRSTASGRRRMNSLSRNSGEPESSDPRLIERFAEVKSNLIFLIFPEFAFHQRPLNSADFEGAGKNRTRRSVDRRGQLLDDICLYEEFYFIFSCSV